MNILRNLNLAARLLFWFVLVGLLPLTLVAVMSYYFSSQLLTSQVTTALDTISQAKAQQIELYASERQKDIGTLSRQPVVADALASFTQAFVNGVNSADYQAVEGQYKAYLTDYAESSGYYDLFLISSRGDVVFTVAKEKDFGTNLYTGQYKDTELARIFTQTQTLLSADFSDFKIYAPSNTPAAFIASPIFKNGKLIGAVGLQINTTALYNTVNNYAGLGTSGEVQVGSKTGNEIIYMNPLRNDPNAAFKTKTVIGSDTGLAMQQAIQGVKGNAVTIDYRGKQVLASWRYLPGLRWGMVVKIDTEEAYAPVVALRNTALIMSVISLAAVLVIAALVSRSISRPIVELTKTAETIAAGDINLQAKVESRDEIGTLAGAFNTMTARLREFIATLEERVAARTKDLATVAEIGTATSTILDLDQLLHEVVETTKARFNLYHAHIYLMDEAGENLVLTAGAGEPGRIMVAEKRSIPLTREQSLVARAARERRGVTVNDVTQAPDFLPNPLLPDTRSELAVPMIVGDKVLGVFDIQSDVAGRFTDADVNIQNTLAAQLAVSAQNARQVQHSITLAAELAGFRTAVTQAAIIAVTDVSGKIEEVNDRLVEISKYPREELIGQDHRILNSGYHSKEFIRDLWVTIANGKVWRNEFRNKAKDGSLYWVDTTIAPILNDKGKPIKYVAIRFDITQRKELELEIAKRAALLGRLDAITQKIQNTTDIETALQVAARELGHAVGMKPTTVTINPDDKETVHEQR